MLLVGLRQAEQDAYGSTWCVCGHVTNVTFGRMKRVGGVGDGGGGCILSFVCFIAMFSLTSASVAATISKMRTACLYL